MRIMFRFFSLMVIGIFFGACASASSRSTKVASSPQGASAPRSESNSSALSLEAQRTLRAAGIEPSSLRCNSLVVWDHHLSEYARAISEKIARAWHVDSSNPELSKKQLDEGADIALGYLVRSSFNQLKPENVGVMLLKDRRYRDSEGRERPLLIFRSGVTTDSSEADSCLRSLVAQGGVKHMINLYGGDYPFDDLIAMERQVAQELGATHFDGGGGPTWRRMVKKKEDYEKNRKQAEQSVAELINSQILRPYGKAPEGNIYFHCGGGMHRTGMIYGILQRCINGDSMEVIEEINKRHTAYRSPDDRGGFELLNLQFIRDFDCSLLNR